MDSTDIEERFKNQSKLINQKELASKTFCVIGAGAIGSFFTLSLAKMGAEKITVFDSDTVEEHNVANQFHPLHSVGGAKVSALAETVFQFTGIKITAINQKFEHGNRLDYDFVISAVDSMDVRSSIWKSVKESACRFFIDGRMGAQVYNAYAVKMDNQQEIEYYESQLFPSSEAEQAPCAEKSIIFTVLSVAGCMVNAVHKLLESKKFPTEIMYDHVSHTYICNFLEKKKEFVLEVENSPLEYNNIAV